MEDITSITVNESSVIPVTPEQVRAFTNWVTPIYRNYTRYKESIYSPVIDEYIYTHILTPEMKTVLRVSGPGNNVAAATFEALGANRFKIYRRRVIKKIKYMKEKLGKLAFREDYIETLRERDEREQALRAEFVDWWARNNIHQNIQNFAYKKTVKMVTQDFVNKDMDDSCVICMEVHKMSDVCVTSCGHQFGSKCMSLWNKPSCPLCRTYCTEITEYKVDEIIDVA